jgi:UDP-GlcNAc3NAcA epimerase
MVSLALAKCPDVRELLVHTGQHYDHQMSQVFFDELGLPEPDVWMGVGSGSHGKQTGRMLEAFDDILLEAKPDWVVVYGDTNSTLAGALAAAKLLIPVAHVEAGLRSFNRSMPEEINRVVVDHVADLLFAPTALAVENLAREGVPTNRVHRSGDVMYDASIHFGHQATQRSNILQQIGLGAGEYLLATVHRAANTDDPVRLGAIFRGLREVAREHPIVVPLHPRTRQALASSGMLADVERELCVLAPVGYLDMLRLEMQARLVVTDSGGVQKEAFFFKVPCVTLREETEWAELVDLGWNTLLPPTSEQDVARGVFCALQGGGIEGEPYGGGGASDSIANILAATRA